MNIQSLSIVVPTGYCQNRCQFCVSRMHCEDYGPSIITKYGIPQSYINRIKFVHDCGCNTMMITGTAEPQQNLFFINQLMKVNKELPNPFYNIEIQTSGTSLTPDIIAQLTQVGVVTLALSLNSFDDDNNWDIMRAGAHNRTMTTDEIIKCAHQNGMNVRVSLNLTSEFAQYTPDDLFSWACAHDIEQLTFRKIYASNNQTKEDEWIAANQYPQNLFETLQIYVTHTGTEIARLPFGNIQYSVNGISVVIDTDCMAKENIDNLRYAILRPNGKLYSRWDDKGSLIF